MLRFSFQTNVMDIVRSKQNKEAFEQTQQVFHTDPTDSLGQVMQALEFPVTTTLPPSLFDELSLKPWLHRLPATMGGAQLLCKIVESPIYDTELLRKRQQQAQSLPSRVTTLLKQLKPHERDVLWILGVPPLKDAWAIGLLFPRWPIVSLINHIPILLALYHIFRAYLAPWSNVMYPLSTIFGPYIYIRKTLKWNLSISAYLKMLKLALSHILRPAPTISATITRYVTLAAYAGMFIYGTIQSFDMASMLRGVLSQLAEKLESIQKFVATFQQLVSVCKDGCGTFLPTPVHTPHLNIPSGMSGIHALWTDESLRNDLKTMLHIVYAADVANTTRTLMKTAGWCVPTYEAKHTTFLSMGHPLLQKQVRNPLSLQKNLIITGPNAAGKTTYMKAICCNVLMSQSLGVACARQANVVPIHAIGSFMRVSDTVGKDSLFEAEAKRCADILEDAKRIQALGHRALYFLDEPMHSTPPIEGAATAMAVIKHLGNMSGIRVFVTTHYHNMIELEKDDANFLNISMEARPTRQGFIFPYRIRRGPSLQCIAIELLQSKGFPPSFIQSAIGFKNKICRAEIGT